MIESHNKLQDDKCTSTEGYKLSGEIKAVLAQRPLSPNPADWTEGQERLLGWIEKAQLLEIAHASPTEKVKGLRRSLWRYQTPSDRYISDGEIDALLAKDGE